MYNEYTRFPDRAEAGRQLGARLATMGLKRPVIYALPRGGVPVALEVARTQMEMDRPDPVKPNGGGERE